MLRDWLVRGGLVLALAMPSTARAQSAAATAEALFREGRALMDEGRYDVACDKLAASQELDPASGTLLNLARCHHLAGETASAWAVYIQAVSLAKREGNDARSGEAQKRADELLPVLNRVEVAVPAEVQVPDLSITLDGLALPKPSWGSETPVDPGKHTIVASAPGYESATVEFTVEGESTSQTVTVPALVKLPEPEPEPVPVAPVGPTEPTAPAEPEKTPGKAQRTVGWIVGGVGIVGLGVGAGLAGSASSQWSSADCTNGTCPDADAQDKSESAKSQADIATVAFVAGGVLAGTGLVLVLTAPRNRETVGLRLGPMVGADGGGLVLSGRLR